MDVREKIMFKIMEISKKERFNSKILERASPFKKIREGYIKILSSFLTGISPFMFEENKNSRKYSQKKKMETLKIIELHFEKIFRDYLRNIKGKYPENVWKIENN